MRISWWLIQIVFLLVSLFFLVFGVDLLLASYGLKDPFSFIMTFFAASLVILISAALGISFVIKMVRVYRYLRKHPNP